MNDMLLWKLHLASHMDIKIKLIKVEGPDMSQFPYKVTHAISIWSPQWREMVKWLNTVVGESKVHWCWVISSEICFADSSYASKFALAWC